MSQADQSSHIFRGERIGRATSLHHPEIYVTRVGTYVARSCRSQLPPLLSLQTPPAPPSLRFERQRKPISAKEISLEIECSLISDVERGHV